MPCYRLITLLLLFGFFTNAAALDSQDFLPPDQAFRLTVAASDTEHVALNWRIADGYHLYRDKIKIQSRTESISLATVPLPTGAEEHDATLGDVVVYRDNLDVKLPLINGTHERQLKLLVKYQGCADVGVCYPPQKVVLDIDLPVATVGASATGGLNQFVQGLKGLTPGLFSSELLPPEQAFQFFAEAVGANVLRVNWRIADGYYLYKDKLAVQLKTPAHAALTPLQLPEGEAYHDEEFGQVQIYRRNVSVDIPLTRENRAAETLQVLAKFQGCADRGVCYPPMQQVVEVALPEAAESADLSAVVASTPPAVSEQDRIVDALRRDSLPLTWLSFFGFGLLLAFTPCVFPMIPILSGIIVGHGDIGTRKAFLLSLSYVLASATMYTVFGVLAALFGSNLQVIFQQPWVIAVFAGLFVLLSLSMFGFYNLEVPKALQERLHRSSDRHRDGSYWGAAIMGALSSLVVGPCVAAPLAAALIYIGQTGDVWLGGSALFAMGLGMGMPLLLLGASAGRLLPKAGAWLNTTKSVFGVLMLAVAVWMLARVIPAQASMFLYAMLLVIPAIFLNAIDPLPDSASGWRKLWKGVGIILLVLGILELIGLSAGNTNPLQPMRGVFAGGRAEAASKPLFERVKTLAELEQRIQQAASAGKSVMLDFYAEWCISCKEMEAYTFADSAVKQTLAGFVLLQADVTDNSDADQALLKRFDLIGPPGIIFFGADGREKADRRVIGYQDAETFLQTLKGL
ncbi:protein-disulfide reductase DsbD [Methylomonas sp. UP202]|uniref:protein-disulfide reductase DsbD n=1 Tax=Methylomonas sp. UP202 TaxID=3040943 RepID=UPI00247A3A1F|nr:protein-disulfide reductase DsbD [Methylomonas sp. UP202]WGS84891.1 protein-disulfide reductase DsbD [Methylomonas sp. UP202]